MRHLFFISVLFLGGCQLAPTPPMAEQNTEELTHWQANGRFAYKTHQDGGSASVRWQQEGDQGYLRFSGPMGFGSAELHWEPGYAELTSSKGTLNAPSAEILAYELTGLLLPAEALLYWLRGLPWPHDPAHLEKDDEGRAQQLTQMGWQLTFDRWQQVQGYWLPHRLKAKHEQDSFTLVIQQWNPAP